MQDVKGLQIAVWKIERRNLSLNRDHI